MFDPILNGNTARTRRPLAVALSFTGQVLVVSLAVLVPILRPEAIALGGLLHIITAPPGRGEPEPIKQKPAPHTAVANTGSRVFVDRVFRQPARVPQDIEIGEREPPAFTSAGPVGPAIPGSPDGVPWGVGNNASQAPAPAPPHPAPPPSRLIRVKVGGVVQAAKLQHQVMPVYPPLARQARISGTVRLEAVIGRSGTIQSLQVTSGHPLLAQAALDAVRQWTYQPTLLNGDPVEVLTQIEVNFKLGE
ncbi:MAG: TonB family protein [Acidobacteriia bacterium]|nr:TonB family protein [Terriglobia bacterium]